MQMVECDPECKLSGTFDYSAVANVEAAALVKKAADNIRAARWQTIASIIEIGKQLSLAKELLGYGHFTKWLGAEFDWDERTARNYMRLAEVFGDKTETVSVLQPTTLYLLSAKSTPPKIVAETIARLKVGERIDQDEVRAKVQEARAHARRERAEARLTTRQRKHKLASREKRELALLEHQQQPARDREAAARAVTAWINLVGAATATALVKLQQQHLFFDEELRAQVAAIEQEEAS